jgi:hypothetical protein
MSGMGPVDYIIVEFPCHKFNGDIVPAPIVLAAPAAAGLQAS